MIDYKDIGMRVRTARIRKKMTQEQLASATGVGTTHISHIETGNTMPSLQLMIDIANTLECSMDELLCIEVDAARPYYNSWITELMADCDSRELKLISDTIVSMKASMRRLGTFEPEE